MPSRSSGPSLPDLAPYLEKLRDFPAGQILLGIVGVHGCAARALGRGREASGLRRPGLGLAGSAPSTVQPSLSRSNTHTLDSARPDWAPLRLSPWLSSQRSRRPRLATSPRARAAGSERSLPGLQAARPPGEGRRERRRREDSAAGARQQSACLSRSARRALCLRSRVCGGGGGGGQSRCAGGAECGGGDAGARDALSHTPPCHTASRALLAVRSRGSNLRAAGEKT